MSSADSVTRWIEQLKAGDQQAAQPLWERYYRRLVRLARAQLRGARRRAEDESDVALSAFDSFCRGAAHGRFPLLADRDNLWPLLVTITRRKAIDLIQRQHRVKFPEHRLQGESAFLTADGSENPAGIQRVPEKEATRALAGELAEEFCRRLDSLGDDTLRAVAQWKLEGYSNEEIAQMLNCVVRTVERKLRVIRSIWGKAG
jgi:RNA polymerase sigma factor (sigma-70 family)